ncbi:hypothetical protein [Brevibacterium zhoupengii]|uniref:hypothetical protein n=1 Tax=Brevibacterium zhoupengii TaxID=2898795 RepID=UPI001E55C6B6|nr:hypothetical protein [Brevibacterium zhoupengii]
MSKADLSKECAKWRTRCRELEAHLTIAHRQIVQHAITTTSSLDPRAVDDAGINISELFHAGTLDHGKLREQLKTARTLKPWLFTDEKPTFTEAFQIGES